MEHWFRLCTEACLHSGVYHDLTPKERWQWFVKQVRKVWNIPEDQKIHWFKINLNETAKKLGCDYWDEKLNSRVGLNGSVTYHLMTDEEINHYRKICEKLYGGKNAKEM